MGITISLDVRDQHVDVEVARVTDGVLKRNWDGGYTSDLFMHLVKHEGYRGRGLRTNVDNQSRADESPIQRMIDAWAELLTSAGERILKDSPDSLPH